VAEPRGTVGEAVAEGAQREDRGMPDHRDPRWTRLGAARLGFGERVLGGDAAVDTSRFVAVRDH
jgi:hypothetical protein